MRSINFEVKVTEENLGLQVGDYVRKVGGDYSIRGIVVAVFEKVSGEKRFVVECLEGCQGLLHIYSEKNLAEDQELDNCDDQGCAAFHSDVATITEDCNPYEIGTAAFMAWAIGFQGQVEAADVATGGLPE